MTKPTLYAFLHAAWIIALCGLVSCEKAVLDEDNKGDAPTAEGNLVLKVSFSGISPMELTRADDEWPCTKLNFVVYQDGTKVKNVNQTLGESGYGQAAMTLDAGIYQVLVLAHSSKNNPTLSDPAKIQFTNADGFSDTFYYYGDIKVTDQSQTHDIELERATAMVHFIINDQMPNTVKSMQFYYTGGSGALNAKTGLGCVASKQSVTVDVDPTQEPPYEFCIYTMPREQTASLEMKVTAHKANEDVLKERSFSKIPIERNKITEYAGSFFSDSQGGEQGNSQQTFRITASAEWADTIHRSY